MQRLLQTLTYIKNSVKISVNMSVKNNVKNCANISVNISVKKSCHNYCKTQCKEQCLKWCNKNRVKNNYNNAKNLVDISAKNSVNYEQDQRNMLTPPKGLQTAADKPETLVNFWKYILYHSKHQLESYICACCHPNCHTVVGQLIRTLWNANADTLKNPSYVSKWR